MKRWVVFATSIVLPAAGCRSSSNGPRPDAAVISDDAGAAEAGPVDASDAEASTDVDGPGAAGADCTFNRDCERTLRCGCKDGACACEPGPRGTGKIGIDTCEDGSECASSVCVEGPASSGASYCSGPCTGPEDCAGALPECFPIEPLGAICIRKAP